MWCNLFTVRFLAPAAVVIFVNVLYSHVHQVEFSWAFSSGFINTFGSVLDWSKASLTSCEVICSVPWFQALTCHFIRLSGIWKSDDSASVVSISFIIIKRNSSRLLAPTATSITMRYIDQIESSAFFFSFGDAFGSGGKFTSHLFFTMVEVVSSVP